MGSGGYDRGNDSQVRDCIAVSRQMKISEEYNRTIPPFFVSAGHSELTVEPGLFFGRFRLVQLAQIGVRQGQRAHHLLKSCAEDVENFHLRMDRLRPEVSPLPGEQRFQNAA